MNIINSKGKDYKENTFLTPLNHRYCHQIQPTVWQKIKHSNYVLMW